MKHFTITFLILGIALSANAQIQKYFSLGVGVNQSTFLLEPGIFTEGEIERMWGPELLLSPEVSGKFNFDFGSQNTLAITANIILYRRIYAVSLPITARYDFNFTKKEKCPFIRIEGGYSLFLTSGAYYGMGMGYQFGKFKASMTYGNQFRNKSILEDNEFLAARIAAMSIKLEYAFRKR